jgi:hypothetical protein
MNVILKDTGLGQTISNVMGSVMQKLLVYAGAGPMFDGTQPGNVTANLLVAGGSATAETSTRDSGGIASTPQSLAFSSQLADQFTAQQKSSESLYDRYASLNNATSLLSSMLMSFHPPTSLSGALNDFSGLFTGFPKYLGNILSGQAFVHADNGDSSVQIANLSGVQTYDIPQACVDLDPLDPNYLNEATNAQQITNDPSLSGSALGYDTLRDGDKFWAAVYAKIGANNEAAANRIYDCALLDARVEGSMGYLYGYSNDNGLAN